jgi:hypothetical protein
MDYDEIVQSVKDNRRKGRWDKDIEVLWFRGLTAYRIYEVLKTNRADISRQTVYNRVRDLRERVR